MALPPYLEADQRRKRSDVNQVPLRAGARLCLPASAQTAMPGTART
jgi:hypothetical protein